ncbi:hypothetical protein H6764_01540 [Candidatus Nomurabacteria bacterium]|nr:hypothetical protein [Candidatus Nomurabacteria bacterium]
MALSNKLSKLLGFSAVLFVFGFVAAKSSYADPDDYCPPNPGGYCYGTTVQQRAVGCKEVPGSNFCTTRWSDVYVYQCTDPYCNAQNNPYNGVRCVVNAQPPNCDEEIEYFNYNFNCCVNPGGGDDGGGDGGGGGGEPPPPPGGGACGCCNVDDYNGIECSDTPPIGDGDGKLECCCGTGDCYSDDTGSCLSNPSQCGNDCSPQGSCSCNPVCPEGSSTDFTGELCYVGDQSCNCNDCLGDTYTNSGGQCYSPETNVVSDPPAYIGMIVAGFDIHLSSTGNTVIPRPLESENEQVQAYLPAFPGDTDLSRAVKYRINFNNQGPVPLTAPWRYVNNNPSEDFFAPIQCDTSNVGTDRIVDLEPGAESIYDVLDHGYIGGAWSAYATVDACQDACKNSSNTTGNYVVNSYPTYSSIENVTAANPDDYLGCSSTEYSSRNVNNPVNFKVKVSDVNGASNIETIAVWFKQSGGPPTIQDLTVYPSSPYSSPEIKNNNSFGFLVEKARNTNQWKYVFVPHNINGNNWIWWRDDTNYTVSKTQNTDLVRINGASGNPLAIIRDVSVNEVGNDATLDFKIEFITSDTGITPFEQVPDNPYELYAAVGDEFEFKADDPLINRVTPSWNDTGEGWDVDMTPPTYDQDVSVVGSELIQIDWHANEPGNHKSGLFHVVGDASYSLYEPGDEIRNRNDPPGQNYGFSPSADLFTNVYPNQHLWYKTGISGNGSNGSPVIQIFDLEEGSLDFCGGAFDHACNTSSGIDDGGLIGSGSHCVSQALGKPWMMSRAGHIYSKGGTSLFVPELTSDPNPTGFLTDQNYPSGSDSIWDQPFRFQLTNGVRNPPDYDISLTSEGLLGLVPTSGLDKTSGFGYSLANYTEQNNTQGFWFDELKRLYTGNKSKSGVHLKQVTYPSSISANKKVSNSCSIGSNDACVYVMGSSSNLSIGQNFQCDLPAVFFINGSLTINPDLLRDDGEALNGCVFVVQGDVDIKPGKDQNEPGVCSSDVNDPGCYPMYDLLEAFIISEGQITIEPDERVNPNLLNDGLLVHGSLVAFGGNASNPSIVIQRSLKLVNNLKYPSAAFHYDPRYLEIAKTVFGREKEAYRKDIGFKPL